MKFVFFSKTMLNFTLKQFKTQENCQVSARLELNSKADLNHAERFLVPFFILIQTGTCRTLHELFEH